MSVRRKSIMLLLCVLCAAGFFVSVLLWRGAISDGTGGLAPFLSAFVGAASFAAVMVFGYGDVPPRPERAQADDDEPDEYARLRNARAPAGARIARPPGDARAARARNSGSDETMMLFGDTAGAGYGEGATVLDVGSAGLWLAWDADGKPGHAEIYEFPAAIGRDTACKVVVPAQSVSRRHAEIAYENGEFYLTDLGSANGSAVNGAAVNGAARLSRGCTISLGRVNISVEFLV
ncbi:MAG: FHA domain-containing protein [Oscillospiraceae bacterium]|jgi:hypothetical protein|nr:FHA domain-containing protein [Oscillospiraceae bacterium]